MERLENNDVNQSIENCTGAFSYYRFAWQKMWKYFLELLLITIISFLVSIPTWGLWDNETNLPSTNSISIDLFFISLEGIAALVFFSLIFILLLQLPLEYGISYVNLKAARNEKVEVKDMFSVFKNYWNAVFANILVGTIIGFGFMLLVIPGIIFACKLAFVPYLIVDRKMEAVEAVKESWRITTGYTFTIFLIGFSAFFIGIAGLVFVGVGIIISFIWIRLAFAAIYYHVSKKIYLEEIDSNIVTP